MNRTSVIFVMIVLVQLLSTEVSAGSTFNTGYELYNAIQVSDRVRASRGDESTSMEGILVTSKLISFIDGFVDGLALMQDMMIRMLVPSEVMTPSETERYKELLNLHRLNIPKDGLAVGQVMLIYKKF